MVQSGKARIRLSLKSVALSALPRQRRLSRQHGNLVQGRRGGQQVFVGLDRWTRVHSLVSIHPRRARDWTVLQVQFYCQGPCCHSFASYFIAILSSSASLTMSTLKFCKSSGQCRVQLRKRTSWPPTRMHLSVLHLFISFSRKVCLADELLGFSFVSLTV
jgi:hypothetical protein